MVGIGVLMPPAKPIATATPKKLEDPDTQYIVYRQPVDEFVEGVGVVKSHKEHRVPLADWPEFERKIEEGTL